MTREGIRVVSPTNGASYKLGRRCGSGSFGEVYRAKSSMFPQYLALKFITTCSVGEQIDSVLAEINLTKKAASVTNGRCPAIHDSFALRENSSGEENWTIVIVLDFIDGMSVSDILRRGSSLSEEIAIYVGNEILSCLRDLHAVGLVHRDIKSSNILVSRKGEVYICDFGVAKALSDVTAATSTLSGTPFWMAPEMLLGGAYSAKIDIFSLGITLAEMVLGRVPMPKGFRGDELDSGLLCELRKNCNEERVGLNTREFSRPFRNLVSALAECNPSKRPDASQALSLMESFYGYRGRAECAGTGSISSQAKVFNSTVFNPKIVLQTIVMSLI